MRHPQLAEGTSALIAEGHLPRAQAAGCTESWRDVERPGCGQLCSTPWTYGHLRHVSRSRVLAPPHRLQSPRAPLARCLHKGPVGHQWAYLTTHERHLSMRRYVLTGTPGAGKTSILQCLAEHGYEVVEEAATAVIAP
ncbi:AAA family ATPase [Streptomyces canus]|uniref:AAA family ATPase n=1 Tax=Streptomyces canus TaxID=58343 RepID=UPI0037213462